MTKTKTTWFDKLPPQVRHSLLVTAGVLVTWAGSNVTALPTPLPEIGGLVLTMVALYVTKITKQYGVGAKE